MSCCSHRKNLTRAPAIGIAKASYVEITKYIVINADFIDFLALYNLKKGGNN